MISLIYRDWALIKKTRAIYFGLFYLFFLIPDQNNNFMIYYSTNFIFIFFAYLFFSYLTAYDYKYNGLAFTAAFPVSKKDIVLSRYIFIAMAFIGYLLFLMVIKTIIHLLQGKGLIIDFQQAGLFILIFAVFFSIIMPLYYKFGYQKIRWIMFIAMFIAVILASILQQLILDLNHLMFLMIVMVISLFIYYFSVRISCQLLSRRDL